MNNYDNHVSPYKETGLGRLIAKQRGVFSRSQALEAGFGRGAIQHRLDAGWLGALRVTGLARTLIDLGAVVSDPAVVEAAMESALRRDEQLFERMKERLEILGGHGRRGAGVLRELLALGIPMRRRPRACSRR